MPQVDQIVVLKDGHISESGTYEELLASKGAFSDFLIEQLQDQEDVNDENPILSEFEKDDLKAQLDDISEQMIVLFLWVLIQLDHWYLALF